jgi:hypothetical protein
MSTVATSADELAQETRARQAEFSRFLDTLAAKGANKDQISFAKMQLLNVQLLAVNAVYQGKARMDREAEKELL